MSPLTMAERDYLDGLTPTACHPIDQAAGIANEAAVLADKLNKCGIQASVSATVTAGWAHIWLIVRPTTATRLADALTRLDLVEDETRHRRHPHGWHDVHIHGLDVPLFVLLDETAKQVPA